MYLSINLSYIYHLPIIYQLSAINCLSSISHLYIPTHHVVYLFLFPPRDFQSPRVPDLPGKHCKTPRSGGVGGRRVDPQANTIAITSFNVYTVINRSNFYHCGKIKQNWIKSNLEPQCVTDDALECSSPSRTTIIFINAAGTTCNRPRYQVCGLLTFSHRRRG